mgnify:CR=1 FL=1
MPVMDGFEMASIIRKTSAYDDIPIYGFTSTVNDTFRNRAQQIGFVDFIDKTDRSALLEKIHTASKKLLASA